MQPSDINLLGYVSDSLFYTDVTLSMESSSVAYCCQRTTNATNFIYQQYRIKDVNYLDDLGSAEEEGKVEEAYDCLRWIPEIWKSYNKACSPPSVMIIFLEILFNTLSVTLQIAEEYLKEVRSILSDWLNKWSATLTELQSLLRKAKLHIQDSQSRKDFHGQNNKQNKEISKTRKREDQWTAKDRYKLVVYILDSFDGVTIMPLAHWDGTNAVFTNSCIKGCGGWSDGEAFHALFLEWIHNSCKIHIDELELLVFTVTLKIWTEKIRNRNVLAFCDNQTSVEAVNSEQQKMNFPKLVYVKSVLLFMWNLFCFSNKNNAMIKLVQCFGGVNQISDSLSRWPMSRHQEVF